ncbi:MAG TPA: acetyl-CoA carboxylase biotin carboxyl carrier protein [Nitrospirae bacterium]|nr:biotin carboxyl carrier protein of acetyl-CoA carboxylase [bacterium BMS3Abin08]HDY71305.1 acetyl-CoA carboxylase biotin carboxyl carrier protein [Nitrospirota bacterium]
MNLDEIQKLIDLLKDTDISEILIEKEGIKLRLKRERFLSPFEIVEKKAEASAKPLEEVEDVGHLFTVTSPIVGTFYRATSPETDPFVNVGSRVNKGQVLCIIEAMKLMNEIECEVDGVVVRVLVENGQPVEYGEPLFLIEPV